MPAHDCHILGQNIRALRLAHHLTQKEMAVIGGIGVSSLRRIEQGVLPPRADVQIVFAVCAHFSIPPAALFSPSFNASDRPVR